MPSVVEMLNATSPCRPCLDSCRSKNVPEHLRLPERPARAVAEHQRVGFQPHCVGLSIGLGTASAATADLGAAERRGARGDDVLVTPTTRSTKIRATGGIDETADRFSGGAVRWRVVSSRCSAHRRRRDAVARTRSSRSRVAVCAECATARCTSSKAYRTAPRRPGPTGSSRRASRTAGAAHATRLHMGRAALNRPVR